MKLPCVPMMALMLSSRTTADVFVSDAGDSHVILLEERVPNVLGSPWEEDRPITVVSPVPVSVLRYSDYPEFFLEGGQALYSHEILLVVKSDCGDDATLIPQVKYGNYTRSMEWDNSEYTGSINVTFPDAEPDAIDTETVLEPSVFTALWSYTSGWCKAFDAPETSVPDRTTQPSSAVMIDATTASPGVAEPPRRPTMQPSSASTTTKNATTASPVERPSTPPSAVPVRTAAVNQTAGSSAAAVSAKSVVSLLVTLLSGVFMMFHLGGGRGSRNMLLGTTIIVAMIIFGTALLTTTSSSGGVTHAQSTAKSGGTRKLQECKVTVEILLDGCRRLDNTDNTDLLITAPSVVIYDGQVMDLNTTQNLEDECVTDYQADLVFTVSETDEATAVQRQQSSRVFPVPSFGPGEPDDAGTLSPTDSFGAGQYSSCFRPVEGRPYIDSIGRHIHAPATLESTSAWSATADNNVFEKDETLGKKWLDRAVGEHASVPAFAAFTIALMSNNAPPELVKDALSAAQDEVRHAETSFEIASLLLGETVEPGPLPPSSLNFGQDLTALALAAAKEGCVDETLSALVAGLEVDHDIGQNSQLSEATKSVLKEKMRTIALEETRHSGLAWRTVRWACSVDENACIAVQNQVFTSDYVERAFSKRFGHSNGNMLTLAKQVWEKVHGTLVPIVLGRNAENEELRASGILASIPILPCVGGEPFIEQESTSFLEEMGLRIVSHLVCSP